MVVKSLPPPTTAQSHRLNTLISTSVPQASNARTSVTTNNVTEKLKQIHDSVCVCNSTAASEENEVVLFVSKLMPVKISELTHTDQHNLAQRREREQQERISAGDADCAAVTHDVYDNDNNNSGSSSDEVYVALARVFSGVVTRNTKLFMLHREHDPYEAVSGLLATGKGMSNWL
jgi:peptide subunit release factor 1 (eRF1)